MNWTTLRNGLGGLVAVCIAMWIAIFFNYYGTKVFAFTVGLGVLFYDAVWIMDRISNKRKDN